MTKSELKRFTVAALVAVLLGGAAFAQAADSGDASFFSGDAATAGAGTGTEAGAPGSSATSGSAAASSSVSIDGTGVLTTRAYLGPDDLAALGSASDGRDRAEAEARARLGLSYSTPATEYKLKLNLDYERLGSHPEDLIDEAYMNAYLGDWTLSAGKQKIVWGKGDEIHVVDLVNADDYTDFLFPKYVDRRLGETLVRLAWAAPAAPFRLEAVWTPTMTAARVPESGPWMPTEAKTLQSLLTSYVGYQYATLYGAGGPANSLLATEYLSSHSSADAFLPNTLSLDYAQYALRATGTVGSVDLGASYYYGHFKTPSVRATYSGPYVTGVDLSYDRLQSLGLEAAAALGAFNLRAEGAYYLTDDIAGTDPAVKNNRLAWEAGFDVDLPVHNLNFNVQGTGTYILRWSEVDNPADVDHGDYPSADTIVIKLADSFNHEKVLPAVKVLWGIEHAEFVLEPELEWKLRDDFSLKGEGAWFLGGSGGAFDAFMDNDFARFTASYSF